MSRFKPWARVDRLLLALGVQAVLAATAQATVVQAVGLDQMISEAELIVRGTVAAVEPRWSDDGSTIYTYVTFADVAVVHGQHFGPLTLRFEGGEVGGYRLEVHGMPTFRKGEEQILFLRGNGIAASPVVGLFQGGFNVVKGLVYDQGGSPLVGISNGTLVKLVDDRPPAGDEGGISIGAPERAVYEYAAQPDHDRLEATQGAAAAAAAQGRYPKWAPGKGTGVGRPSDGAAAPPAGAATSTTAAVSAPRPAAIYVPRSRDDGRRLTTAAFIDAVRARLGE